MTSNSVSIEHEERPPIPSVPPLLPETKLDVSLSLDQIIGDLKFEGDDVDPKCASSFILILLEKKKLMCARLSAWRFL